MTCASFDQMLR